MRILIAALLVCSAFAAKADPVKVVASFSILADLARNAGGNAVDVTAIIGPDGDPHGYEPKPSDARKLAGATVLVVNGLGLDSWVDRLAAAAGFHGIRVVASDGIAPIRHGPDLDPHAWQAVPNAILYVRNIAKGLATARPADQEAVRSASDAYEAKLRELDAEVRELLKPIPAKRRRVVVPHRAFDYFGRAYAIEFLAPLGTNADAEATGGAVAGLVEALRHGQAEAVFGEHLEDRRIVEAIATDSDLPIAGELYSDCLSPPGGPAANYIELIQHNARLIARTLTPGEAPRP